jgi:hypothetical protein
VSLLVRFFGQLLVDQRCKIFASTYSQDDRIALPVNRIFLDCISTYNTVNSLEDCRTSCRSFTGTVGIRSVACGKYYGASFASFWGDGLGTSPHSLAEIDWDTRAYRQAASDRMTSVRGYRELPAFAALCLALGACSASSSEV